MKKLSRIKQILSVALVSVLAATVMPSTASANGEYYDYEDVVTVEVDLGGGPGEEVGCEGVATLELPDNTLRARLDSRQPGITDPDIIDYLLWWWGSGEGNPLLDSLNIEPTEFTNDDLDDYVDYLVSRGISPVLYVGAVVNENATVDNLTSIAYDYEVAGIGYLLEDTNQNGVIEETDAPDFLTETRRVYSSDLFEVSYEATDCVDSSEIGVLYATRGYVERLLVDESDPNVSSWADAEADWDEYTSSVNRGQAYLRGNLSALGGFISIPAKIAMEPYVTDEPVGSLYDIYDWDPIALGDAGSVEMRAVMKIFGASPTGKYRTQFYYQLLTGEENYITCGILNNCY
jgi:hypothetical protein